MKSDSVLGWIYRSHVVLVGGGGGLVATDDDEFDSLLKNLYRFVL